MIYRARHAGCHIAAALALCLIGPLVAPTVHAQDATYRFDLPAQSLADALRAVGRQTGKNILFDPAMVEGLKAPALRAELTLSEAIDQLLHGTQLRIGNVAADTLLLERAADGASAGSPQAANGSTSADSAGGLSDNSGGLEEIIVTATKREESIQNLPSSISAIGQEAIERRNLVGMGDYLNTIPGVSINDMGAGRNFIVIRGIGISDSDKDITGVYFGEIPLTSLVTLGSSDIKLVDMSRVEVLRGPQGTLYGAGAMGGAVRSIPAPPDTREFAARVSAMYSRTAELGGDNANLQGIVNVPLLDGTVAVRAVGYKFRNSGLYENLAATDPAASQRAAEFGVPQLAVDKQNVGSDEYTGGRLSLLWTPNDRFGATLSYINQDLEQNGFPEVELSLNRGEWAQSRLQIPPAQFRSVSTRGGADQLQDKLEAVNLVLEYDLGWADLVSSTSWVEEFGVRNMDSTYIFGFPAFHLEGNSADAFFQELRLSSKLDGPVQFIAGAFYEDLDRGRDIANRYGGDPALNPVGNEILLDVVQETQRRQQALFGEVTYDITDTLAATLGSRLFRYEVTDRFEDDGLLASSSSDTIKTDQSEDSYKANLTYKPHPGAMFYAQFAQGFRLGYPDQPLVSPGCDTDNDGFIDGTDVSTGVSQVESDFLDTYELGGKFMLLDNRLSLQTAIYQANWKGMPVRQGFECIAEVVQNLGEARSRGAELFLEWQLTGRLKGELGASYTDATVAKTIIGLGSEGDRLPGSPRYSYNFGLQYDFSIKALPSFIEWNLAYRGEFYSNLEQSGVASGDYYLMNARWGLTLGQVDLAIFGNNLTNEDGFLWVAQLFPDGRAYRVRPRTVGVEMGYRF